MRHLVTVLGIGALLAASSAAAADKSSQHQSASSVNAPRELYVCDRSQATERSFEKKFGEAIFVTAREALAASRRAETWGSPRCISDKEYQKLMAIVAERQQTIRLTAR